ncbi:MAG TPA: ArsA family ATPase [Thermoplasmata archaeon]|nr:ArsA family ATPase [Thermoplasmata archaeon]
MRVIIYTGKGGVGKTSLSAATALRAASRGQRALVISTDNAHSLGDCLATPLGPDPLEVRPNLFGLEIDVLTELDRHWSAVREYLLALLASQGVEEITAQEVVVIPGMELIAALLRLEELGASGQFDVVVLDTAPTADTLRLLSFPNAVEWYFDHVFRMQRRLAKVMRTTVGKAMRTPIPPDSFFATLSDLHQRFARVRELLSDGRTATVRLVVNPEKMVIAETQRAYTYLCLFGLNVELLVVNRIFPTEAMGNYFHATRAEQNENLATLKELFGDLPQLKVPRYPTEVIGLPALERLGEDVFGKEDPARRWPSEAPIRFRTREGSPIIELALRHASSEDVELVQRGDTLYLRVGAYRRTIALPVAYVNAKVDRAYFDAGTFVIRFAPRKHASIAQSR